MSGGLQPGEKYVLKKFQEELAKEVEKLFCSIKNHTMKMVQMNPLDKLSATPKCILGSSMASL